MFPYRVARTAGLWAVLLASASGAGVRAGETQTEDVLAKFGLRQAGTVLVLEAESDVHKKTGEVRQLYQELSNAVMLQRSTMSEKDYKNTINQLNAEINLLKSQFNATNQTISRIPKFRGRFMNNMVAEQSYELNFYKRQLQWEIDQRSTFLKQLKSRPFDPKARSKRDADVRDKTEALQQAGQDLRQAVDAIKEKYAQIAKDPAFKKALGPLEREAGTRLKLEPSPQFRLDVKLLEKLEMKMPAVNPAAKGPQKLPQTTKGRPSTKSADGKDPGSPS
jgi:hypothetical protein